MKAAQSLTDEWLTQHLAEVHTLLPATAGEPIRAMLALRHQPQRLAAGLRGLPVDENGGGWSPADLPPLRAPPVKFGAGCELPGRLSSARLQHPGQQLKDALQRGVSVRPWRTGDDDRLP